MTGKPAITKLHSLGKNERLKSHKIITKLFKEGQGFTNFPIRVLFLLTSDQEQPVRAGFSASSRNFKKAVDRNRIKRLLRETYRIQKNNLHEHFNGSNQQLSVFFIFTGRELPDHQLIFEKMKAVLDTLVTKTKNISIKNK